MGAASASAAGAGTVAEQAARRRTFAIISHPDAGTTTLPARAQPRRGAPQAVPPRPRAEVLHRHDGALLALFAGDVPLERFERDNPGVALERLLTR